MPMHSKTVFVAGAGGAVGRRLCPLLVRDGWRVVGTTRAPRKCAALRTWGVEPVVVDVFDAAGLLEAMSARRPSQVIHQLTDLPPGLDPERMAAARLRNAQLRDVGTRNLLSAARACGVERVIVQSVAFVYAPGVMPYREEAPLDTESPDEGRRITALGVASLERQVLAASLTGIVLRYGRLYGPGTGFEAPARGAPLHVDAAADAARRALERGARGVYNVAEEDGAVSCGKARCDLGWTDTFRLETPLS